MNAIRLVPIIAICFALAACAAPKKASPYKDITDAYQLQLDALTEAVEQGRMTLTQAKAEAARLEVEANNAAEVRRAARAKRAAASTPMVCSPVGYSTLCY